MQHAAQVLGGARHEVHEIAVEGGNPDPVALRTREVCQRRGEVTGVLELAHAVACISHRRRNIEQQQEVGIGVGFVLLHVEAVGAREQPPVHAPDVVARRVWPVLREVGTRSQSRRTMQAANEPLHDGAGEQLEIPDPRENGRVEKGGHHSRGGVRHRMLDRGMGTRSSSCVITRSDVTRSDCARKFVRTRCRITGCASARMSSKPT